MICEPAIMNCQRIAELPPLPRCCTAALHCGASLLISLDLDFDAADAAGARDSCRLSSCRQFEFRFAVTRRTRRIVESHTRGHH